jgi:hypothetical protein
LSAVSVQTGAPVAHEIAPTLHALVAVQAPPATQAAHAPLLHTMFVPHAMPFACAFPVSMHSRPVVAHLVCPTWHGLEGVQALPAPLHASVPPAPANDPPLPPVPASEPPTLPPIEPPLPPTPPLPPAPTGPPAVPPVPAVPAPPSGDCGSTRRPHANPAHPNRTDAITTLLNIMSPLVGPER